MKGAVADAGYSLRDALQELPEHFFDLITADRQIDNDLISRISKSTRRAEQRMKALQASMQLIDANRFLELAMRE